VFGDAVPDKVSGTVSSGGAAEQLLRASRNAHLLVVGSGTRQEDQPVTRPHATPVPKYPIRIGEPCTLCVPGASGPQDCGLVQLVFSDPGPQGELRLRRLAQGPDHSHE